MKNRVPILLKKLQSTKIQKDLQQIRPSVKLQTSKHGIREFYVSNKSFYL